MTPLMRLVVSNALRSCHQCQRPFSSTASRMYNAIDALDRSIATPDPNAKSATSNATTGSSGSRSRSPLAQSSTSSSSSQSPSSPAPPSTLKAVGSAIKSSFERMKQQRQLQANKQPEADDLMSGALAGMARGEAERTLLQQTDRKWRAGDVYSLHDLSPREAAKWAKLRTRPQRDIFEMIGQDPIKHYKNMPLLSEFITETGRIKHSKFTGLKAKNQRKLAKAIRRAIGSGLIPSVHRHPEVIAAQLNIEKYR